jgi:hypothetical protein
VIRAAFAVRILWPEQSLRVVRAASRAQQFVQRAKAQAKGSVAVAVSSEASRISALRARIAFQTPPDAESTCRARWHEA